MRLKNLVRLAALAAAVSGGAAHAAGGSFTTFTYNVAGLPEGISSAPSDRQSSTRLISCYVKQFGIVNVQEDFNYHAALYDSCDDHPYRSPTSGGAGVGSGLNTLSRFPYTDWERVSWDACNGVDCLTPKGFTLARTRLAEGVYVDVYNLHAQAQTADADLTARRKDLLQLLNFIETYSAGNAVLVMGDTNTRYTRSGDNAGEFLRRGFTDVWVDKVRAGSLPDAGAAALLCDPAVTSPNCEVVDKVFYRDNGFVGLQALSYFIPTDMQNALGQELSDHRGIKATWSYATAANRSLSDPVGGPHGTAFNDVYSLPANPAVSTLTLRSGSRVDQVEVALSSGDVFSHGGSGGTAWSLTLGSAEYVSSATLCTGDYNGNTRVFFASFATSAGRTLSGGTMTAQCSTYAAPVGWQIVGFHGRSGDELDKLGFVYAPTVVKAAAASYVRFVNVNSNQCLGTANANLADGASVAQWSCSGADWQKWRYDAVTGLIRNKQNPRYCLDNSGTFADGAKVVIQHCTGSVDQRFDVDASSGAVTLRTYPTQALVVSNVSTAVGANVQTWTWWGSNGQRWNLIP